MGGGEGWESAKENIQPLSCGRKMATMSESLPSSHHHESLEYETHHLEEVSKMEMMATRQLGSDPLQEWVNVVKYMDQHFLSMSGRVKVKYIEILKNAAAFNFGNGLYQNDRRLANLIIKSMIDTDTHTQIKTILKIFDIQRLTRVSVMYTTLADLYEQIGNEKMASDVIRRGMENQAEPKSDLEEKLTHIQNRWAEKYAKQLEEDPSASIGSSDRFVAASVPVVGENNEAISIRQNLQPAKPLITHPKPRTTGNHQRQPQKLSIYDGENSSSVSVDENVPSIRDLSKIDARNDAENNYDPTRWNAASTQLDTPAIPAPCEKLQLYVDPHPCDTNVNHSSVSAISHHDNGKVLRERKDESETVSDTDKVASQNLQNCLPQQHSNNRDISVDKAQPKKAFFDNIKYKVLPRASKTSYTMMTMQKWKIQHEQLKQQKIRDFEEKEINKQRKQIEELTNLNITLENKLRLQEVKLLHQEDKILSLESRNQELINQLTSISTENNVRESEFMREKVALEEELEQTKSQLHNIIQRNEELQFFKNQYEILLEEKRQWESENQYSKTNTKEFGTVNSNRSRSVVDVQVCSNNESLNTELEVSVEMRNSEDNFEANSFLPVLEKSEVSSYRGLRERLPESECENNYMNDTPSGVGSVQDFDMKPPSYLAQFKPPMKKFSLYESININKSLLQPVIPVKAKSEDNIRSLVMGNLQKLSENQRPELPIYNDENSSAKFVSHYSHQVLGNNDFVRPNLPIANRQMVRQVSNENLNLLSSDENRLNNIRRTENLKSRMSIRGDDNNLSDDDDIILGQNQHATKDLTFSNLTTMLQMKPQPLTNSTPEKRRDTFSQRFKPQLDVEESLDNNQAPRYSVLNEPQMNLSTIQETSRERSSRSTTSSSSSNTTNNTHYYTSTTMRSSSVPRGTSYSSHHFNSNGYYSDTNHK